MQNFAQLLQAPLDDANAIIGDRFPAPRLVVCDQYGSQVSLITYQKNPPKYTPRKPCINVFVLDVIR